MYFIVYMYHFAKFAEISRDKIYHIDVLMNILKKSTNQCPYAAVC